MVDRSFVSFAYGGLVQVGFVAFDVLFAREHVSLFFMLRLISSVFGVLSAQLAKTAFGHKHVLSLMTLGLAGYALAISVMTVVLGGFSSDYFIGNMMILFGSVLILGSFRLSLLVCLAIIGPYILMNAATYGFSKEMLNPILFLVGTGAIVVLVHRETELSRLRDFRQRLKIEHNNEQLRALDEAKSRFFANISHELRTPLTLIIGSFSQIEELGEKTTQTPATVGLRNASRLLLLINDLLDLSRLDHDGRRKINKEVTNMAKLVRTVTGNFDSNDFVSIKANISEGQSLAEIDPNLVKTVLYNLLSNACKFSRDDGRIIVRLRSHNDEIRISVQDFGIGIPKDRFEQIFERFSQVNDATTREYGGTGIGLALAKEIATAHDGRIVVNSTLGKGSTFTLCLPVGNIGTGAVQSNLCEEHIVDALRRKAQGAPPKSMDEPHKSSQTAVHDHTLPTILIVEDNDDLRLHLRRILASEFRVTSAKNGQEGLERARQMMPELVITDMMMPRMNGQQLLEAIRKEKQLERTPVILLTARTGMSVRLQALQNGAQDFLSKPFNERELIARAQNLVRLRRQEIELEELNRKLAKSNQTLEQIVRIDPLTLVPNRRAFEEEFEKAWKQGARNRKVLSVIMCDVDNFKDYNDTYGHQAGDECLKIVGCTIASSLCRPSDFVARYGGEEFVVVLPDTDLSGAGSIAERIRMRMLKRGLAHSASPLQSVTLSLGVASETPTANMERAVLLAKADACLYDAKKGGRNRVACDGSLAISPSTSELHPPH